MKEKLKNNKGITLVALVVTIIILIILAGISISMLAGQDGIITKAQRAKENMELAAQEEQEQLNELYRNLGNGTYAAGSYDAIASLNNFRKKIAKAITDKGVTTSENDSADTMAENIGKIEGTSGGLTTEQHNLLQQIHDNALIYPMPPNNNTINALIGKTSISNVEIGKYYLLIISNGRMRSYNTENINGGTGYTIISEIVQNLGSDSSSYYSGVVAAIVRADSTTITVTKAGTSGTQVSCNAAILIPLEFDENNSFTATDSGLTEQEQLWLWEINNKATKFPMPANTSNLNALTGTDTVTNVEVNKYYIMICADGRATYLAKKEQTLGSGYTIISDQIESTTGWEGNWTTGVVAAIIKADSTTISVAKENSMSNRIILVPLSY